MRRLLPALLLCSLFAQSQEVRPVLSDDYRRLIRQDSLLRADKNAQYSPGTRFTLAMPYIDYKPVGGLVQNKGIVYLKHFKSRRLQLGGSFMSTAGIRKANRQPALQQNYVQGRTVNGTLQWRGPETNELFSYGPPNASLQYDQSVYPYDIHGRLVPIGTGSGGSANAYNNDILRTGSLFEQSLVLRTRYIVGGLDKLKGNLRIKRNVENLIIPGNRATRDELSALVTAPLGKITLTGNYFTSRDQMPTDNRFGLLNRVFQQSLLSPVSFDNGQGYLLPTGQRRYSSQADNPWFLLTENGNGFNRTNNGGGLTLDARLGNVRLKVIQAAEVTQLHSDDRFKAGTAYFPNGLSVQRSKRDAGYSLNAEAGYYLREGSFSFEPIIRYLLRDHHSSASFEPGKSYDYQRSVSDLAFVYQMRHQGYRFDYTINLQNKMYFSNTSYGHSAWLPGASFKMNFSELFSISRLGLDLAGGYSRFNSELPIDRSLGHIMLLQRPAAAALQFYPNTEVESFDGLRPVRHEEWTATMEFNYGHVLYLRTETFSRNYRDDVFPFLQGDQLLLQNIADHRNSGLELSLTYHNNGGRRSKSLRSTHGLSFFTYRNKVLQLGKGLSQMPIAGFSDVQKVLIPGQPVGAITGSRYLRDAGNNLLIGNDGFPMVSATSGVIGNPIPDFVVKCNNTLNWRWFKLAFDFEWKKGGDVWNGTQAALDYYGRSAQSGALRNTSDYVFAGVAANGHVNNTPVAFYDPAQPLEANRWVRYGYTGVAEVYIQRADWIRINDLSLSHTFRRKNKQADLTVGVTASNLLVWTPYEGATLFNGCTINRKRKVSTSSTCLQSNLLCCMSPYNSKVMKKQSVVAICSLLLFLSLACKVCSQVREYASSKEKVYLHTNHVYFKPGETIYFKVYVIDARTQKPSFLSQQVYVDVSDPSGKVLQKLQLPVGDGYAEGSWTFEGEMPGGVYKLTAYTNWMRNEEAGTFFTKEVVLQRLIAPRILMKLEFPEKGYGAGDEVKASFSMRSLLDRPIAQHTGHFTVSIGGIAMATTPFQTDEQGKAQLHFRLPATLTTQDGLLNVVVTYDGHTESIARSIPILLNKVDLQFLPEGGHWLEGVRTTVAFKAVNEQGKGVDVKGNIVDKDGRTVTTFQAFHRGMGKLIFTPLPGQSYKALISQPAGIHQSVPLPQASPSGVSLQITQAGKQVLVDLRAVFSDSITLTASSRDQVYFKQTLPALAQQQLALPEELFPVGIAQFTVSCHERPLAERLVFMHHEKQLRITLSTDKALYQPREEVVLSISTTDGAGKALPANLSVGVIDDKLWSLADDKQDNILSWLLMSSELGGKVEEPYFYFDRKETKAAEALDLVMLTHGYRYFDHIQYVRQHRKVKYLFEDAQVISGTVVDYLGNPLSTDIYLIDAATGRQLVIYETGKDGGFYFSQLTAGARYWLLAKPTGQFRHPVIRIGHNGIGYDLLLNKPLALSARDSSSVPTIQAASEPDAADKGSTSLPRNPLQAGEEKQWPNREAYLEDVVVVAYGTATNRMTVFSSVSVVSTVAPNWLFAGSLQGKVAGLSVLPSFNQTYDRDFVLRGARSITGTQYPLFVVDGIPMSQFNLQSFDPGDINYISVMKDAAAVALYGSQAANGVIVIETKKNFNNRYSIVLTKSIPYSELAVTANQAGNGTVVKRFYVPAYPTPLTERRSDFRETIYWNGVVQTNGAGKATVSFYNSDAATTFRAIAEGIGYDGKVGRAEVTYSVTEPLTVDVKIPPYLTVGDSALLPMVISNNSETRLPITIKSFVPPGFQVGAFNHEFYLEAGKTAQVLIPVQATQATSGAAHFVVSGLLYTARTQLPIIASQKGFPIHQVFSGTNSNEHHFAVTNAMPGSSKVKLKVLKELDEQLMDGIESMLREPGGCFEQTSSTLYPNILILQYLRSKGVANSELERKALNYIRNGYKRLLTFETAKGGFEWFGHTPPNLALTAYGLLEFTDMQPFIEVDKNMLQRTKALLLNNRNGRGGFDHAQGGYGRYAYMAADIANCFIVYALSESGMGHEFLTEYEHALQVALASSDGYLVPLMALAANNLQRGSDYRRLMDSAMILYRRNGLKAKTSVVNSHDRSLNVEALSLFALAMLREKKPDMERLHGILSTILAARTEYGFGATQATVLALRAITEYKRVLRLESNLVDIRFAFNDRQVKAGEIDASLVREGNNKLLIAFNSDSSFVPYQFELSYYAFTPVNSDMALLQLNTQLQQASVQVGETVRMNIEVVNRSNESQAMGIAKIGIPAGLSVQPWQLKEIMEKNQAAYYEIFDNWLVFYWTDFMPHEVKKISLDLKAEIPGVYRAKASNTYLYYTPEHKHWNDGITVTIKP